ncbi:MAG: ATP-binding protein [Prosthecobacter sp.]|nr:ATP-binding protein [Prosthecobacter sp.]
MKADTSTPNGSVTLTGLVGRAEQLYRTSQDSVHQRTDRMFALLMVIQWVAGVIAALWISPLTWAGTSSQLHIHVWAAVFLGGAISAFPIILAYKRPGHVFTRHVIAAAQTLTSALLIHLTGGRIETHFHVFGSLAFLAFYRDWRVLVTATVVVAGDHLLRGLFWPQSVFGVLNASSWRWLEHAGWVLFEDTFLIVSIRQSLSDMREVATRRAELESQKSLIELEVLERTEDLTKAHQQLLEASRHAGMAEVATNVLHNVGNVLNSVNVSAETVANRVSNLRINHLKSVAELLREHADDLPNFLSHDPRGRELPGYMVKLAESLVQPQTVILDEIQLLRKNIDHVKEVVSMQQNYARGSNVLEKVPLVDLVEDAIRINSAALLRHEVKVVREYEDVPAIMTDRHQVLQILVNLLSNAKQALNGEGTDRCVVVRVGREGPDGVKIAVADNGIGIPQENLTRVFQHGFTTRKDGHGFGLHSGALAARELGGNLTVQSEGAGHGAVFTLVLPMAFKHSRS